MSTGPERTIELLKQLIRSKKNLSDTLVSKGEEASFNEPFNDLVQKAADYIPKSYIFVDEDGNETSGFLINEETIFDATENDVREGKVFGSETGVKMGTKFIPSYITTEGVKAVPKGSAFKVKLADLDKYDYTKLQAIICKYNKSTKDSVEADKISVNDKVYATNSTKVISTVTKNDATKEIDFEIVNNTENNYVLRYFTYKEI